MACCVMTTRVRRQPALGRQGRRMPSQLAGLTGVSMTSEAQRRVPSPPGKVRHRSTPHGAFTVGTAARPRPKTRRPRP